MYCDVYVSFGSGQEYEFKLHDADLRGGAEMARRWLDEQFVTLGCEPSNPVGKTLIVDKILAVASALGNKVFGRGEEAAHQFARNTALALGRETIRVDVAGSSISY